MNLSKSFRSSLTGLVLGAFLLSIIPSAFSAEVRKAPPQKKEWAFLTYLNGFNSLDDFGYLNMNQMEKVGSTARAHVVVQWASMKTREVHRIYVNKDNDPTNVTSPVLENLGQVDMGDYRTLIDFVKWAVANYPAEHYFLNIWNHGNGWHFTGRATARDLSYDDLSNNHISTEQLGIALDEISKEIGHKIDVFGADACLMAMSEVAGEMKNSVDHFVGSEEVEPGAGWPYDTFLTNLNAGGPKSPKDVVSILSKDYVDLYTTPGHTDDATLSGMDLSKYSVLAAAVRELGAAIRGEPVAIRQKILGDVQQTLSYSNDDYKDLGDFLDVLSSDLAVTIRPEVIADVRTAISQFVVANHATPSLSRSHGVSIWFPNDGEEFGTYQDRYKALAFNQDTNWIDAIASTLQSGGRL